MESLYKMVLAFDGKHTPAAQVGWPDWLWGTIVVWPHGLTLNFPTRAYPSPSVAAWYTSLASVVLGRYQALFPR